MFGCKMFYGVCCLFVVLLVVAGPDFSLIQSLTTFLFFLTKPNGLHGWLQ